MTDSEFCVIDCGSAEELIFELDETRRRWQKNIWLYRGQNDVSHKLIPATMRRSFFKKHLFPPISDNGQEYDEERIREVIFGRESQNRRNYNFNEQIRLETVYVQRFMQLAEYVGLAIPGDHYDIRNAADLQTNSVTRDTDVRHYLKTRGSPDAIRYALAQHHRIPTRLLDWTFRPQTAAYFASLDRKTECEDSNPSSNDGLVVIWAVRRSALKDTSLELVGQAGNQIDFMRAQEGVLMYDSEANWNYLKFGQWRPFERELAKIVNEGSVYKFTLPYSRREELSQLLRLKRATKAFLMPTYDNVAEDFLRNPMAWIEFFGE